MADWPAGCWRSCDLNPFPLAIQSFPPTPTDHPLADRERNSVPSRKRVLVIVSAIVLLVAGGVFADYWSARPRGYRLPTWDDRMHRLPSARGSRLCGVRPRLGDGSGYGRDGLGRL